MSAEVTPSGWYRHINGDPKAVMGWSRAELEQKPGLDLTYAEDVEVASEAYMAALDRDCKLTYVGRVVGADGAPRWVRADIDRQRSARGETPVFVTVCRPAERPEDGQAWFRVVDH